MELNDSQFRALQEANMLIVFAMGGWETIERRLYPFKDENYPWEPITPHHQFDFIHAHYRRKSTANSELSSEERAKP